MDSGCNENGQVVRFIPDVAEDVSLDIQDLPAGLYILRVTSGAKSIAKKIVLR
ncbi:MAG: T9SS type A sorting domain-containing protein [Bacteroidales bacterium]